MIKENSTNQINKKMVINKCPVAHTLGKIGGRWKPLILFHLSTKGKLRYNELKKSIEGISEKMLIQHLKELEVDNLIIRKSYPVVPPFVEYTLSNSGKEMSPILQAMAKWGLKHLSE
jgi:DNA-binding HxlR family transcriptional regulator